MVCDQVYGPGYGTGLSSRYIKLTKWTLIQNIMTRCTYNMAREEWESSGYLCLYLTHMSLGICIQVRLPLMTEHENYMILKKY